MRKSGSQKKRPAGGGIKWDEQNLIENEVIKATISKVTRGGEVRTGPSRGRGERTPQSSAERCCAPRPCTGALHQPHAGHGICGPRLTAVPCRCTRPCPWTLRRAYLLEPSRGKPCAPCGSFPVNSSPQTKIDEPKTPYHGPLGEEHMQASGGAGGRGTHGWRSLRL